MNNKILQKVDIAEALTKPDETNSDNQHMVTPGGGYSKGNSETVLESCWSMKTFRLRPSWKTCLVKLEIRNGEIGMKYVRDGEARWTPVVRKRRKKRVRVREFEY